MYINGLHHVTTIASDPQANIDFYTGVMGLRLVKVTVNFDAPEVYHLYYGDGSANPGSILTFFPWPGSQPFREGLGQTNATAFAVPTTSIDFWKTHLASKDIHFTESERFGEQVLSFADHDTTKLEIIGTERANDLQNTDWISPTVPNEHAIQGFHGVTLWEASQEPTATLLIKNFGYERIAEEGDRVRYQAQGDGIGQYIDIIGKPGTTYATGGAGSVHHIAFRTPNDDEQLQWLDKLRQVRLNVTPVQDRQYFHSIYFREPGGVLFEIATDEPGFYLDETDAELGQDLKLPPWLEANRERIANNLQPITRP